MKKIPTRSNLLRTASTPTVPPICKSKDGPVGLITECDCETPHHCETTEYTEITLEDFLAIVDGITTGSGSWVWFNTEEGEEDRGSWNYCTPAGQGKGNALVYVCADGSFLGPTQILDVTYLEFYQNMAGIYPHCFWTGTWTRYSDDKVFPADGSACP